MKPEILTVFLNFKEACVELPKMFPDSGFGEKLKPYMENNYRIPTSEPLAGYENDRWVVYKGNIWGFEGDEVVVVDTAHFLEPYEIWCMSYIATKHRSLR